jgi:hypothetical protein
MADLTVSTLTLWPVKHDLNSTCPNGCCVVVDPAATAIAPTRPHPSSVWQYGPAAEILTEIFALIHCTRTLYAIELVSRWWRSVSIASYTWKRRHTLWYGRSRLSTHISWRRSCHAIASHVTATSLLPEQQMVWAARFGLDQLFAKLLCSLMMSATCSSSSTSTSDSLASSVGDAPAMYETLSLALYLSCQYGHYLIVQQLLRSCKASHVDIEYRCRDNDTTPLWVACYTGSTPIVRALLAAKARVDCQRDSGSTPLFIACELGHCGIVRELLQHGASPLITRIDRASPLHVVCSAHHSTHQSPQHWG